MATASAVAHHTLPWDTLSPQGDGLHHIAMNHPNQHYHVPRQQQHVACAAHATIDALVSVSPTQDSGTPANLAAIGKRSRSSDEEDVKVEEAIEDEGRKKRSRGRPRLDTKDETAADRRRTQIRLAQRAYRHRKDTAITTLEKRVKELEKANNDISKDFNTFFSVLVSERVLDTAPHALQRLSSIANKITNTADQARATKDDSGASEDDDDEELDPCGSGQSNSALNPSPAPPISPAGPSPGQNVFPLQSSFPQASLFTPYAASAAIQPPPTVTSGSLSAPFIHVPPSVNYEVVTAATPHNASFPFYSSMERSAVDEMEGNLASAPSPYGTLASPGSYAANEQTFGRRLQRHSLESALRLIMSLHPPPDRFAAVFGFCLFFESREDIIKRLQAALNSSQHEDLSNWKFPFTNLGGAGTFFQGQSPARSPTSALGSMPIGAQGTRSYGKPQEMTGMSMGPWGPAVQATRDERIDYGADRRMQMMLAGFEGDFFDPDEVETHLRQLGVFIPQRADFIHAELSISDVGENDDASQASNSVPSFHGSVDSGYAGSPASAMWATNSNSSASAVADASCPLNNQSMGKPPMMAQGQAFMGTGTGSEFGSATASYMMPTASGRVWPQLTNWPTKIKATIDVAALIRELTKSSVCLGRAPGVRRKDINAAIKTAAGIAIGGEIQASYVH